MMSGSINNPSNYLDLEPNVSTATCSSQLQDLPDPVKMQQQPRLLRRCVAVLVLAVSLQQHATTAAPIADDFDDAHLDHISSSISRKNTTGVNMEGRGGGYQDDAHLFQPNQPLLRPGYSHEYRYRTRTLTTPHEGTASTGVELSCIVHLEVDDSGIEVDTIVTMTITKPHVFRLGTAIPDEQG